MHLASGETDTLAFTITPAMMELVDEQDQRFLEPGRFCLTIGSCSPTPRGLDFGVPQTPTTTFTIIE